MRRRFALLATVLAALFAALLTACSAAAVHPRTLPTLTASPTASPTPTPSTSDLEAATDVVRQYYALLNAATTNANAEALARLMTTTCRCQEVARSTREVAAKHERYFGKTVLRDLKVDAASATVVNILVSYDYDRSGIVDERGNAVTSSPGRTGASANFRLRKARNAWLIDAIVYLNKGQSR